MPLPGGEERRGIARYGNRILGVSRTRPLAASGAGALIFCLFSIAFLDIPVMVMLHEHVSPELRGFFHTITDVGLAGVYIVPALLLWLGLRLAASMSLFVDTRETLRRYSWSAAYLLVAMLATGIAVNLLKFVFGRYRPRFYFENELYGLNMFSLDWGMNSFPSGHSQAIWTAMIGLLFIFPRYDLAFVVVAVLVSASRMFIGVHYLSDVVAGSYVGIAGAILVYRAFQARGLPVTITLERDRKLASNDR